MSATPSLRTKAAHGVLWSAIQIWTVRATTAGAFIVIGRQLQPAEFGLVALAMSVIGVLTLLSDSGLATFIVRQKDLDERTRSTAFWTSMGIAVVLAALLALLATPVSALFGTPALAPVLRVLSLGVVLTGLNSVPTALLRREMRFKSLAVRGTIATVSGSVVAIVLALMGAGVWALVAQSLLRGLISVVIIWTSAHWFPKQLPHPATSRAMLSFGTKLLSIDLLIQARDRGEEFVLAGISGATTLGYWSVATRLMRIIQETGSSVISSVTTPTFAKLQDDRPRLYRAYETSMTAAGMVMFPAMLFLTVTSTELIPFLLGKQWATTATVAQITTLTAVLGVFSYFDRQVVVAINRLRPEIVLVAVIVATHLGLTALTASHGLVAVALALFARTAVFLPIRQIVLHRVAGVPYRCLVQPMRVLLAASIMAGVVVLELQFTGGLATWASLLVAAVTAGVVYVAALLLVARPVVREFGGDLRRLRGGGRKNAASPPEPGAVANPAGDAPDGETLETSLEENSPAGVADVRDGKQVSRG
ncbi:lipopolysaccharide biosynthesis protein [Kineococcus sp. GCM10028916]|uniref:lipopolysaccharide biosynthesis protein n=1 Tax=Kineococcus sp. GCM10028916 TaxID=3273394 RepID=UPI00363726C1